MKLLRKMSFRKKFMRKYILNNGNLKNLNTPNYKPQILRKRICFTNIKSNKETPSRNHQKQTSKLIINYLPDQEVSIEQKIRQVNPSKL